MTIDLRLGDCLSTDGLASLPDLSVDVVITDPPYSSHVHDCGRRGAMRPERGWRNARRCEISRNRDLGFEHITQEERERFADQCARLAKRWILVFCDAESIDAWRGALESACSDAAGASPLEYVRTCFWHKLGATPQFTGDRPASHVEAIVCAHRRGRKRWNGGGRGNVYPCPIVLNRGGGGEARVHTTQKPYALMAALVSDFSAPGETVLDAYSGSATTLLACERLGRNSIGWERDPANHAAAQARIATWAECARRGVDPLTADRGDKPAEGQLDLLERTA